MREIKFRAWDKSTKEMFRVIMLAGDTSNPDKLLVSGRGGTIQDAILMQYIGLSSEQGTEAYEGDIVTAGDNYPSIIEWQNNPDQDEFVGFCLHEVYPNGECDRWHMIFAYTDGLGEIIGNIHENPELLEKETK